MSERVGMPATVAMEQAGTPFEASRLCTQCGLCCDGTLFGRARVLEGDEYRYSEVWGVSPGARGNGFPLPCTFLEDRICSIYPDRPKICGTFKCHLLMQFEDGQISFAEAKQAITQAVEHAARVRTALEAAVREKDLPLRRLYLSLKELASLSPENAPVFLEYAALQVRLDRHFRKRANMHGASPAEVEPDAGMGDE